LQQLVFHGQFRYEFIAPCTAFLRLCAKVKHRNAEFELICATFDQIVQACIPALDPSNNQPFHIVRLPRISLEFALNVTAIALSHISINSMNFDIVSSLGWCCLPDDDASPIPLQCGAVFSVLQQNQAQSKPLKKLLQKPNLLRQWISSIQKN
jgi:hypothetical protein